MLISLGSFDKITTHVVEILFLLQSPGSGVIRGRSKAPTTFRIGLAASLAASIMWDTYRENGPSFHSATCPPEPMGTPRDSTFPNRADNSRVQLGETE